VDFDVNSGAHVFTHAAYTQASRLYAHTHRYVGMQIDRQIERKIERFIRRQIGG
jgi:hypothetical protein